MTGDILQQHEAELLADFTRVIASDGEYCFEVGIVQWRSSYESSLIWKRFRRWVRAPSAERVRAAQVKALQQRRFFQLCERCGERNNVGHMYSDEICQTCAERYLGVVH